MLLFVPLPYTDKDKINVYKKNDTVTYTHKILTFCPALRTHTKGTLT